MNKKTLRHPGGLRVELDRSQVFPSDPGQGTPALVFKKGFDGNATFSVAADMGLLDGDTSIYVLTDDECKWLHAQEKAIDEFLS